MIGKKEVRIYQLHIVLDQPHYILIVMTGFEDEGREVDALHFDKLLSLLLQHLWS